MKKKLLIFSIALLNYSTISAQNSFLKAIGRVKVDRLTSIDRTNDSCYIVAGQSNPNNTIEALFIAKLNQQGDTIWTRSIQSTTFQTSSYNCVKTTSDSNYIATGYTLANGNYDIVIAKHDKNGALLWIKTYGGVQNDWAYDVIETADKGFLISAYTKSFAPTIGVDNILLIKTDVDGDILWTKVLGTDSIDFATAAIETSDKGFMIIGQTWGVGKGEGDALLMKTDSAGNMQWNKLYGGRWDELFTSIIATSDGNYVMAGETESWLAGVVTDTAAHPSFYKQDFYLVKTDANGDTLWTRTYGGGNTAYDVAANVIEMADGNILVCGRTNSFSVNAGIYYLKINSNTGDTIWTRMIDDWNNEYARGAVVSYDNQAIIVGNTRSFSFGSDDGFIAKIDYNGNNSCLAYPVPTLPGTTKTEIQTNIFIPSIYSGINKYGLSYSEVKSPLLDSVLCKCSVSLTLSNDTNICMGDSVVLISNTTGNNITWSTGETTNSIKVSPTDTTTYYAIANNDTCSVIAYVTVTPQICTGINEKNLNDEIAIYPNPNNGKFQVAGLKSQATEIKVCNMLGEVIFQSEISNPKSEIDLSYLPSGIYLCKITETKIKKSKIIKLLKNN